jgi:Ca2+-binding RTX toxin-like protein
LQRRSAPALGPHLAEIRQDIPETLEQMKHIRQPAAIVGNSVANSLNGGDGNDRLIGGAGSESLDAGTATMSSSSTSFPGHAFAQPLRWWEDVILFGRHTMSFDRDAMNSVEVDRKDDGFYYKVHFSGDTLREKGPLETREEAMTAGNRELARLEASRSSR